MKKPDILYSRSYPLSSTLLALKLKKKWREIPWILHLSDPWAISYKGDSPATNFRSAPRRWNEKKEAECFELADRISFTSRKTIQLYTEKYPKITHKFILTPNVYDEALLNVSPIRFDKKLNIVYTGGFGEKRNPMFYLQTIKEFLESPTTERNKLNFLFTGPITQSNKKIFDKFISIPEVNHLGLLDYGEMMNLQANAHVLVNIDTDIQDPKHSVFFPSKLLEYFAAGRRILAITNNHSVTYDVIQNNFGDCVEFGDTSALKVLFNTYLKKFLEEKEEFFALSNNIQAYGAEFNTCQLLNEMDVLSQ